MGSFSSSQHLGSWQPFLSYKTGTITSSGVAKVLWCIDSHGHGVWCWARYATLSFCFFFVVTWAVLF